MDRDNFHCEGANSECKRNIKEFVDRWLEEGETIFFFSPFHRAF
jgi:hypothetical protein